jgi:nucleotide-binding universal stress UspA family protein
MNTSSESTGDTSVTWVVGVDGSDGAQHAAQWALLNAPGRASSLRVASAWSFPTALVLPPVGPVYGRWDVGLFESSAQACVDQFTDQIDGRCDLTIEKYVAEGQSSSVLIAASRDTQLLIVGSRGRGGFTRLLMGSTSTQCVTHADAPTVVVPDDSPLEAVRKIVVAVDGSNNSLEAVRWAIDFAAPGSTIECVEVWDVSPIAVGSDQFFFPEAVDLANERFDHQIGGIVDELDPEDRNIVVQRQFVNGRPRQDLLRIADDADLLVTGARGHGSIGSAILGSVSTWLLHHTSIPMVVIPLPHQATDIDDDEQ